MLAAVAIAIGLFAGMAPAIGAAMPAEPAVVSVDSVAMTVSDADRSIDFYTRVLQFEVESDREVAGEDYEHLFGVFGLRLRVVRLRLGDEHLELLQFLTPRGRPIPNDAHANDRSFQHVAIIVSDMQAAFARLRQYHVEYASSGPQRLPDWNPNAGGIQAFYFRDPDGHFLEILAFPPGKGATKWHSQNGHLFLGIDHTAIVVANTDASLAFYRDRLGMRVAGMSENYGTEQEHLNNVFGAHLRITSLRASGGPGVEFLEYLSPTTGRAIPTDSLPNDLWYWQINLHAVDPAALKVALQGAQAPTLSAGAVDLKEGELGYTHAGIVRDPDGHANLIAE
jgi:catechol 2,3-dioxygenase-like lactoylglutathione lyase family enzyme